MNSRISQAISALLNESIENIPAEYIDILHYLFDNEDGRRVFEKWAKEIPQEDIPIDNVDFEQMYLCVKEHISKERKSTSIKKFYTRLQRIAAILLIPLIVGASAVFYNLHKQAGSLKSELSAITAIDQTNSQAIGMEYLSPPGARLNIILPDSSQVCLNGNSRLLVSKAFGINNRTVRIEGEAFFSVMPDKKKSFTVKAGDVDVTALGTSFYVKAYPSDNKIETVLITGKVSIETPENAIKGDSLLLFPNQRHIYYKNNPTEEKIAKDIKVKKYQAWTKGELIFEDESMEQIIERLKNFYNIDITVLNSEINTYRFTASLSNCSMEQIMEYLKMSSPIDYTMDKNKNRIILHTTK